MKRTPKIKIDYTDWTVEQHAEHLRTHPSYAAEFAKYDPKGLEEFIQRYAKTKFEAFKERVLYQQHYEEHQTQFLILADRYLDMILMKKLFNLQCQWRANKIKLPLVEACFDFKYWEEHIRSCPFIPPITEAELALCVAYLRSEIDFSDDSSSDLHFPHGWQDYEKFKNQLIVDAHEVAIAEGLSPTVDLPKSYDCQHIPSFYTFFDDQQGTDHLIHLTDVRGKLEEKYMDAHSEAYRENRRKELEAKGETEPEYTGREYLPTLMAYHAAFPDFIEVAEDDESKEVLKHYYHYFPRYDDDSEDDYEYLKTIDEPVQMIADEDWRFSLKVSVMWFKQSKAIEVLPYAYETYLMEFEEDLPLEQLIDERVARYKFDKEDKNYVMEIINIYKKRILDGREILDGVRDFNF
jgi:hypothetical protein